MLRKVYFGFIILFFVLGDISAQDNKIKSFQHLSISEGLAHNGVTSILEDSRGYIWIGTYDGLNRYDGYEFEVFKSTVDNDLLYSNRVRTISEDLCGNIWIGTDEGLSIFNSLSGKFNKIYSNKLLDGDKSGPIVRRILENPDNGLIVCATEDAGVLVFNSDYTLKHQFVPPDAFSDQAIRFYDCAILDSIYHVFSTSVGILLFNIDSGKFRLVLEDFSDVSNSIIMIENNKLLATLSYGIAVIDFQLNKGICNFSNESILLNNYQFNSISLDQEGNLWLGTLRDGFIKIDKLEAFLNQTSYKISSFSIDQGLLRASCIASSTSYGCWAGTFNKGIYRFNLNSNPFHVRNSNSDNDFGLHSNHINQISVFDNNRIFVSALQGGLAIFNTDLKQFEPLPFNNIMDLSMVGGSAFKDSRGDLWMTIGGSDFLRYRTRQKTVKRINTEALFGLELISIRSYAEDRNGDIWLGCLNDLYRLRMDDDGEIVQVESLNENPFLIDEKISMMRRVYIDPLLDVIWVGTDKDGLLRIEINDDISLQNAVVKQVRVNDNSERSLPSNFVSSIIRLPNEELWIGTEGGGICKVIEMNDDLFFIPFTEKHGLSNNVVKSILCDDEHNLWISTNIGLNKFDTKDYRFRQFGKQDGLPFEDFSYASANLENGTFVFSGYEGILYFNPKEVNDQEILPKLEFGELKIFNQSILPGDTIGNRVLLDKTLTDVGEIVLKHNEDVFSIELTSLHFSNPNNHYIKYQLLPVNDEWIEVPSSQRNINFNGLRPGEYILSVMASNSVKEWTIPKKLKITISPSFWKTNKALALYILVILVLIYLSMLVILRIQSLKYKIQIEHLEKDKEKEVNTAKLRFFSNISHEIKTPLTLISGPIDMLSKEYKSDETIQEKLLIVKRQSQKISQLIDQVHDFQRAEANLLKMNSARFNFDVFIRDLITNFEYLAAAEKKTLKAIGEKSSIYVWADKDKLEKIFNNLLNNAFKYTDAGDSIMISYMREESDLVIAVNDTGKGISSKDLQHIFERFYRSKSEGTDGSKGSGIGLAFTKRLVEMHYGYIHAESELGKSTTIHLRLPVVKNRFNDDQQEIEKEILVLEENCLAADQFEDKIDPLDIEVTGDFSKAIVFIAEDNADMRLFISEALENFFKVKSFVNGQECLNAMEDEWPDIVISDVLMPVLNGFDLCKRIKSDIKTSHIPVILLTGCNTTDERVKGIMDGADAYIFKPFEVQHLVASVEALLRNRQQLRERFKLHIPLTLEKNKHSSNDDAFLKKLYKLMEENLDNSDLDLDKVARALYMNRSHFYQKVKALTNQTPFEFLKTLRLEKAANLLVHDGLNVNEVFMVTGFKSRTHFSKLFKEKYHFTPGKFASEAQKKYSEK